MTISEVEAIEARAGTHRVLWNIGNLPPTPEEVRTLCRTAIAALKDRDELVEALEACVDAIEAKERDSIGDNPAVWQQMALARQDAAPLRVRIRKEQADGK